MSGECQIVESEDDGMLYIQPTDKVKLEMEDLNFDRKIFAWFLDHPTALLLTKGTTVWKAMARLKEFGDVSWNYLKERFEIVNTMDTREYLGMHATAWRIYSNWRNTADAVEDDPKFTEFGIRMNWKVDLKKWYRSSALK